MASSCGRWIAAVFAASLVAAASSTDASARTAIVGGPPVSSPVDAPWSVQIEYFLPNGTGLCTGSLIRLDRVVTAAHCIVSSDLRAYLITAGVVSVNAGADFRYAQQQFGVARLYVHPQYDRANNVNDVAVIDLSRPFEATPGVAPIPVGSRLGVRTIVRGFGWGAGAMGQLDWNEHYLDQGVMSQWRCAPARPATICTSSQAGSECFGDSGGGLVLKYPAAPVLAGVASFISDPSCAAGTISGWTDLAAPTNAAWLAGSAAPPVAPRAAAYASLEGDANVGGVDTCTSPSWSGSPSVDFEFVDYDTGDIVQRGGATHRIVEADVDHQLACVAIATNAGGTAEIDSHGYYAIAPALDPKLRLRVRGRGDVFVSDDAYVTLRFHLTFARAAAS